MNDLNLKPSDIDSLVAAIKKHTPVLMLRYSGRMDSWAAFTHKGVDSVYICYGVSIAEALHNLLKKLESINATG